MRREHVSIVLVLCGVLGLPVAHAQETPGASGFLDDYSQLKPYPQGGPGDLRWEIAGLEDRFRAYKAIVIPQPEIFVAADSKYKGVKPDDMKLIADALRDALASALQRDFQIAMTPGENTAVLSFAVTDVHLKKKGRSLLGYTPVGLVVTTAKRAMVDDIMDKILLTEAKLEAEVSDSLTGERLVALVDQRGSDENKKQHTSWEELDRALRIWSERGACRIANARKPEAERVDCLAIEELPAAP